MPLLLVYLLEASFCSLNCCNSIGDERHSTAAGVHRRVCCPEPDVRRLPSHRGQRLLEVGCTGASEGDSQEDNVLPRAGHPQAQGPREHA